MNNIKQTMEGNTRKSLRRRCGNTLQGIKLAKLAYEIVKTGKTPIQAINEIIHPYTASSWESMSEELKEMLLNTYIQINEV